MRALVVHEPGRITLEDRPAPPVPPGSVLLRPTVVGLCGTDLEIIDGRTDPTHVRYPLVLGHEWCGTVADAGDHADAGDSGGTAPLAGGDARPGRPAPGTRVVVEGIIPCRHCPACVSGATNLCATYDEFGFVRDGAAADFVVAPASLVHPLADGVSTESAALVEPASVVLRALRRAAPRPGMRVLVVGDGTVGLLAVTLVRLWSPAQVTMLGVRSEQAELATAAGADGFATDPATAGTEYDLVVEAAGTPDAVAAALRAPARGGQVILIGLSGHGSSVELLIDPVVNGDVTVAGSFSYTSQAWAGVVELLNSGRLQLGFLVTHRFPLREWSAALSTLRAPVGARGKVLLEVDAP